MNKVNLTYYLKSGAAYTVQIPKEDIKFSTDSFTMDKLHRLTVNLGDGSKINVFFQGDQIERVETGILSNG